MKATTEVVLGIRSVGAKAHEPIIESMTMIDALKRIARFVHDESMAQRFQFTLARSQTDAMIGLGLADSVKSAKRREKAAEISEFIDGLFESEDAPAGGREADTAKAALENHTQGLPRFLESK